MRGRRRIGKSALIKRVLTESDIYFEADRTNTSEQIRQLAAVIAHRFPGFDDAEYRDWRSVLNALNYRATERFTLCLDEFPYLVEKAPALPSVIQGLLDSGTLNYHIVLCGSLLPYSLATRHSGCHRSAWQNCLELQFQI